MTTEITPAFMESLERMNMFFFVHNENKELLTAIGELYRNLEENPDAMVSSQALRTWLDRAGDHAQTVDGLMHIAQKRMIGEAVEWLDNASEEEQKDMREREDTQSLVIQEMTAILMETSEDRIQRILLEALNVHD